jgi:hypothetical protein
LFPESKSPFGLNYIIADDQKIIAIQALPDQISKSHLNSSKVHSNTYLNDTWKKELLEPDYSEERQRYSEDVLQDAYQDKTVTNKELLSILGDKPIICRKEEGLFGAQSLAFFSTSSFGCGTTNQNVGKIPI